MLTYHLCKHKQIPHILPNKYRVHSNALHKIFNSHKFNNAIHYRLI